MSIRRPHPTLVKARLWEINRRYARKQGKVGKRSRPMAAIRLAELTRWLHDTHGAGAELEQGPEAIRIAEIFAHHIAGLAKAERRIAEWISFYTPFIPPREREHLIANATGKPIHWSADKLGWKIKLTDEQRTRLKIRTIGAIGISREQRKERDRQRRAQAERDRRARKRSSTVPSI